MGRPQIGELLASNKSGKVVATEDSAYVFPLCRQGQHAVRYREAPLRDLGVRRVAGKHSAEGIFRGKRDRVEEIAFIFGEAWIGLRVDQIATQLADAMRFLEWQVA